MDAYFDAFSALSTRKSFYLYQKQIQSEKAIISGLSQTGMRSVRERPQINMRILIAVTPIMYRETLAHIVSKDRPDDEVRLADPQALDQEASSFRPHLIVCNDNAPEVPEEVSVPSWVVIRYQDSMSASVFLGDQDPRLIQDIAIEDLARVVEETQRLVA